MDQTIKLILILDQIKNITNLTKDNEWESFYNSHLIPIYYETKRQLLLTKTQNSITIEE